MKRAFEKKQLEQERAAIDVPESKDLGASFSDLKLGA